MRAENDGIYLRSRPYTFGVGQAINIDTNFLQQCLGWEAPEIAEILFVVTGSVTAGAGGAALGRDFAKLFDNIRVEHKEVVVDASGAMLRLNEQHEFGNKSTDPASVTASTTNASYEGILTIPFEFPKSPNEYKRDARIPVKAFMALGGKVIVRCGALPTNWSAVTLNIEVVMRVVEARQQQVNAFYQLQEYVVTNTEEWYPVNGSARYIALGSKLVTTGYTSLAAFTSLDSRTLNWESGFHPRYLRERYKKLHLSIDATVDEHLLAAPGAIPLCVADKDQRIGKCPNLDKLHLDLNAAAPTSGVLLIGAYKDRHPLYSAYSAGYNDQGQFLADVSQHGVVRDGKNTPARYFDPYLVNRLPLRIKIGS